MIRPRCAECALALTPRLPTIRRRPPDFETTRGRSFFVFDLEHLASIRRACLLRGRPRHVGLGGGGRIRFGRAPSEAFVDALLERPGVHRLQMGSKPKRAKERAEIGALVTPPTGQLPNGPTLDRRHRQPGTPTVVPRTRIAAVVAIVPKHENVLGRDFVNPREGPRSQAVETEVGAIFEKLHEQVGVSDGLVVGVEIAPGIAYRD